MAIKISGSTIIDDDRNIVNAGVVTASSFSGDGSQLTGVGIGSEGSINTSGIVTASTISANEFIGSGDKLIFSPTPTSFTPADGSIDQNITGSITITFDQIIQAGVGSIFLRNSSGIGTELEAISIASTTNISISGQTLIITPENNLPTDTDVYVVLPQGVITNLISGNNNLIDTYNFNTVAFSFVSISPINGATNVGIGTSIVLTFTSPPSRGTGTIELKRGNALTGSLVESFDAASSGQITILGNDWILKPSSNLSFGTSFLPIIPNGAILNYAGINTTGQDSYSFSTPLPVPGDSFEGGTLICSAGGTYWIVAPSSTEIYATWYNQGTAVSNAQSQTGCTGWFIPTVGQLQNPGYACRSFWDTYNASNYWSSTQIDCNGANCINLANNGGGYGPKTQPNYIRAFRCVSY